MHDELIQKILSFRDDRDWRQFHNPKDLAISLSLEANELLENFQWSSSEEAVARKRDEICEELADVFIYAVLLADVLDADISNMIVNKLKQNAQKYPVEKAFGKKEKYNQL